MAIGLVELLPTSGPKPSSESQLDVTNAKLTSVQRSLTEADGLCRSIVRWRCEEVRAASEGSDLDLAAAHWGELAKQRGPNSRLSMSLNVVYGDPVEPSPVNFHLPAMWNILKRSMTTESEDVS